jgi:hypothetical protein
MYAQSILDYPTFHKIDDKTIDLYVKEGFLFHPKFSQHFMYFYEEYASNSVLRLFEKSIPLSRSVRQRNRKKVAFS